MENRGQISPTRIENGDILIVVLREVEKRDKCRSRERGREGERARERIGRKSVDKFDGGGGFIIIIIIMEGRELWKRDLYGEGG